jgi:hypothetical protein
MDKNDFSVNIVQNSDELKGEILVQLKKNESLNKFCSKYFTNFDPEQFDAVAIRVYYKHDLQVTLYALDRVRHSRSNFDPEDVPVKKFKSTGLPLMEVFALIEEFNFTLTTGNYPVELMRVINK